MIDNLLEIENKADLWAIQNNNINYWPLIRNKVFWVCYLRSKDYSNPHSKGYYIDLLRPRFLKNSLKTALFFQFGNNKHDCVFFIPGRNYTYDRAGKKFKNGYYSDYYRFFGDPLIFEESYRFNILHPRELEESTYLTDYIHMIVKIKSYFKGKKIDRESSEKFISEISKLFSLGDHTRELSRHLDYNVSVTHLWLEYIDRIIEKIDRNIVFIHFASDLGIWGEITKRFKENGIKVIELQHGSVGKQSYIYNYHSGRSFERAKEYLPDYYLTYGRYWNEQINTPSKTIPVGNPNLNKIKNVCEIHYPLRPKSILVVSQGTVTCIMVKIARYLSEKLPDYKIIYKLHPGEIPFTERYEVLKKYPNIEIRTFDNIYELIASSEIIVGHYSTTLFEAIAFNGKRIFMVENDMVPSNIGYKFSDFEELYDAILDGESGYPSVDPSYFWEPDWEKNISSFLTRISC